MMSSSFNTLFTPTSASASFVTSASTPSHSTQILPSQSQSHPLSQIQTQDPSQDLTTHALVFLLAITALFVVVQIPRGVACVLGERGRGKGWGWVLGYSSSGFEGNGNDGEGREKGYEYSYRYPPANVPRDVGENDHEEEEEEDHDGEYADEKQEDDNGEEKQYPRRMYQHPPRQVDISRNRGGGGRDQIQKRSRSRKGRRQRRRSLRLPPHVPAYPAFLRALAVPMRARFPFFSFSLGSLFSSRSSVKSSANPRTAGTSSNASSSSYTLSQTLILTLYTLPLLYTTFARGSNPLLDPVRSGFLALIQLPIAVALAAKNGFLGLLGGWGMGGGGKWGYERVNWLHRWVGRGVVLGVNVHCWHYFYLWSFAGTFVKNISAPSNMWGMVGLVAVDVMFVFSLKGVRERAYAFFLGTHVLGFVVLLPAIYMHKKFLVNYVLASLGIYALDHLIRLTKTRITHARLVPVPALDMTRIEIPKINRGWRAGQHVRLRVLNPEGAMGGWMTGWMEVHPFTVACVEGGEEGMVLMCKRAGGWTRGLYELAKGGRYGLDMNVSRDREDGMGRNVRMVVEGPYGGPGNTNVASFSAAVYVCGGSGITYALAGIADLVERDLRGESRVKVVELVWVVPDPGCLEPLLPTFADLIHRSVYTPLRISVFYTRAPTGKQPAYFDDVDASPFAAPSPALGPYPSPSPNALKPSHSQPAHVQPAPPHSNHAHTPARDGDVTTKQQHQRHPSHTLISPVSEDAQAFAQAYQQRLEKQRSARPRPPPSQRPASPYEAPRAAPAPPPPSAYTAPKTKNTATGNTGGPQRQDSNASARTLVADRDPSSSAYARKASLKRTHTSASRYNPSSHRLPINLTLAPGRPKLSHFLEHALDRALRLSHANPKDVDDFDSDFHDGEDEGKYNMRGRRSRGAGKLCGMVVSVCGPAGLAEDVCGAVAGLEWERTQRVGGVEVVEEVFGC